MQDTRTTPEGFRPIPTPFHRVPPIFALIADAKARGVVGLRCPDCGHVHTNLHMIGRPCNFAHPDMDNHDGETCGCWDLEEVTAL